MTSTRNTSRFALPLVLAVGLTAWAQAPPSPAQSASPEDRRATALKLPEILDALALSPGSQVAGVAAWGGFLTPSPSQAPSPARPVYTTAVHHNFALPTLASLT